jgi:hypothetical protein
LGILFITFFRRIGHFLKLLKTIFIQVKLLKEEKEPPKSESNQKIDEQVMKNDAQQIGSAPTSNTSTDIVLEEITSGQTGQLDTNVFYEEENKINNTSETFNRLDSTLSAKMLGFEQKMDVNFLLKILILM